VTQSLAQALEALDDAQSLQIVTAQIQAGGDPLEIVEQCRLGMAGVGERFGRGDYYLSELILAADIFQQCSAIIEPHLSAKRTGPPVGTVIMGTVQGDIHDLGKNTVTVLLRCEGFEVIDLGVDVPPERFVASVSESGAKVLGMSCLLTTAFDAMKATVQALTEAELRDKVYIMIGGGPVDERVREYVGADFNTLNAIEGVRAALDCYGAKSH